ncbi:phospholipid carrier-dependent glycosyltransferase [Microcoleus sp. LEGE 07076]|uniref:phospholipid carrier-dependent glycosyltransferase n=1 Tax=Microcoleus sp. LEGE 07076 TaxID=915322 RepID=UPI00187E9D79|nr:phospholipid carrier-dependent glycosyltransferase [Microcoleus sp. LEGE 07076]MBE9184823.1 phospholipid carrier-dependent glycosyltransferase [Microcoleus sp. LEGE 07076]
MAQQHRDSGSKSLLVLGTIWLLGAISDRLWLAFDRSVPAWDQAEYLTSTLDYLQALQHPQWFSGDWWTNFWLLSTKIPPLAYILTVPFLKVFGAGVDRATLVHLLFSAILLASVYNLGVQLFNRQVGLWAAAICVLLPGLYRFRLQFLLDYPLAAAITFCFYCLTMWKSAAETGKQENSGFSQSPPASLPLSSFFWAIAFGISLGLSILVKHTTVLFLFAPIVWLAVGGVWQKAWGKLGQLAGALLLSVAVFGPWAKTNWLLILTGGKRATVDSAIAEGDPGLNTIDAWIYYGQHLPEQVSWPLLLIPLVGLLLYWHRRQNSSSISYLNSCRWLAVFWAGAYLINSLNINKDDRYVIPYLPVLSIFLAWGLTLWPPRWGRQIRWGTIGLASLTMLLHMWPVGGAFGHSFVQLVSPGNSNYPYLGKEWPHREVIAEILAAEPYLQSTLGVLPSTPEINQHNLNYYGALANFQVYGRQVGTNLKEVPQDVRSLSWFVTKTGPQGSIRERIKKAQNAAVATIEKSEYFQLEKAWVLPDNTNLNLYRKRRYPVEIQPLNEARSQVQLEQVTVTGKALPGVALPITYIWSGSWQQLQSGLVLVTWKHRLASDILESGQALRILHDRAIAQGTLHPGILEADKFAVGFRVVDRTAMLTPANIAPGSYSLEATYLNRKTGETYPIKVPPVTLKINADPLKIRSQIVPSNKNTQKSKIVPTIAGNENQPELDLVTQLRAMAVNLPKGLPGLKPVFEQIGRINQYDPTQDYTLQAEQALEYRLKQEPKNLEFAYALAFSRVLQQNVKSAIVALEKVTELDSQNPYAYAYLAFVQLYGWHPKAAETALKPAIALNPNLPEIRVLNGLATLMQGNLIQAWQDLQYIQKLKI